MGLEVIALGLTAASTAMATVGTLQQGASAQGAANYRAAVSRNNASLNIANAQAQEVTTARLIEDAKATGFAGQRTVVEQDQRAEETIARYATGAAASGLTGPGQERVVTSLRALAAQDRLNLRERADTQSAQARQAVVDSETAEINFRNRAAGLEADAVAAEVEGSQARSASFISALGTFAGGAASLGGTYLGSSLPASSRNQLSRRPRITYGSANSGPF